MSELALVLSPAEALEPNTDLVMRQMCIEGLAHAVPEFINRKRAGEMIAEWFPTDELALAALYRRISETTPKIAA